MMIGFKIELRHLKLIKLVRKRGWISLPSTLTTSRIHPSESRTALSWTASS